MWAYSMCVKRDRCSFVPHTEIGSGKSGGCTCTVILLPCVLKLFYLERICHVMEIVAMQRQTVTIATIVPSRKIDIQKFI